MATKVKKAKKASKAVKSKVVKATKSGKDKAVNKASTVAKARDRESSILQLARRAKTEFCVAVIEEMGVNGWLWFPPVDPGSLPNYWAKQPRFGMSGIRKKLGGNWVDDSAFAKEGDASRKAFHRLWRRLHVPGRYVAEVCCDEDSYLISPDGKLILHAGFKEVAEQIDGIKWKLRDWRRQYREANSTEKLD